MEGGGKGKKKWSTDGERWERRKREMERWRGYFSLSVFGLYLLHFNLCYLSHTNTHLLPPSLSFISLCLSFWLSSSVFCRIHLFICNLSLLSLSAAVFSALCRLCEEGVNDVALNIRCVLSTPSHICVCERETPRERQRKRERDAMENDTVWVFLNQPCVFVCICVNTLRQCFSSAGSWPKNGSQGRRNNAKCAIHMIVHK